MSVPGWAELPWLVHGFSARPGGQTMVYRSDQAEPGGELNLGFTAQDSREVVIANRESWLRYLLGQSGQQSGAHEPGAAEDGLAASLVTLCQTHSAIVHRVNQPRGAVAATLEGDGLMTDVPGLLLGILTADCVPVLVVDHRQRAVAAFHAGWRGTLQQIVEQGITQMREEFGSAPEDLLAAVGPAIGACCYGVGEEVREQFFARFCYAHELFSGRPAESPPGEPRGLRPEVSWLDLAEANRRQLLAAGLKGEAIAMCSPCTSCNKDRFFSHRAEGGVTGRMLAVIGIRA